METGTKSEQNSKKKWTDWISVRLGIIIMVISITTAVNQLYLKKTEEIKSATQFHEKFELACRKIDVLEKRIDALEKQFTDSNLKTEVTLARIETQINLILKKLQ